MSRRAELLAEAREWRKVAEYVAPGWRYVGEPWEMGGLGVVPAIHELAGRSEQGAMRWRLDQPHYTDSPTPERLVCGCHVRVNAQSEEWALFCLFLALECEDEARSLSPSPESKRGKGSQKRDARRAR